MLDAIIDNITDNSILPICAHEERLHIYYSGKWWQFQTEEEELFLLIKPLVKKSINEKRIPAAILNSIHTELLTFYKELDAYTDIEDAVHINLKDSIVKISKDGEIEEIEHDEEFGFRWQLPFAYDPLAKCPLFEKFLDEVIGEKEAIDVLLEFMGFTLIPHYFKNLEKSLWLIGSGANGKSVLLSVLKDLYGEENTSYLDLEDLNNEERLTMMSHKLINISQDASNRLNNSRFKNIVSGGKVITRGLYKSSSILKAVPKMVIATNQLPAVRDSIDAFLRRIIIIPFNKTISEQDRDLHLSDKLKEELAGIFNLALFGLKKILHNGHFTQSTLISQTIDDYKGELDILGLFLASNPIKKDYVKGGDFITQVDIFKRVGDFCKETHLRNHYVSPKQIIDKLVSSYNYARYKNNNIYGIRGAWETYQNELNTPKNDSEYIK